MIFALAAALFFCGRAEAESAGLTEPAALLNSTTMGLAKSLQQDNASSLLIVDLGNDFMEDAVVVIGGLQDEVSEPAHTKMLRGASAPAEPRELRRRRRRRKSSSSFEDPCTGFSIGTCETADWTLCKAGCLGISSCVKKCEKAIVDPCWTKLRAPCEKAALDLCEEAIKKAGEKSCTEICAEAAVTADAAGGGPEDPVGDVVAADIEASCEMSCAAAVDSSGLTPGTDAFAEAVCKGCGF